MARQRSALALAAAVLLLAVVAAPAAAQAPAPAPAAAAAAAPTAEAAPAPAGMPGSVAVGTAAAVTNENGGTRYRICTSDFPPMSTCNMSTPTINYGACVQGMGGCRAQPGGAASVRAAAPWRLARCAARPRSCSCACLQAAALQAAVRPPSPLPPLQAGSTLSCSGERPGSKGGPRVSAAALLGGRLPAARWRPAGAGASACVAAAPCHSPVPPPPLPCCA